MIKIIDLCCGIGGFYLGTKHIGETVFACDIDRHCIEVYKLNYNITPESDIYYIKTLPEHNIICAGFPCQSFSKSGKNLGTDDKRGQLIFEILRLAKTHNTEVLFLENVNNLVTQHKETFQHIISCLEEIGYKVSWKILNAIDFGVPQSRKRVIIIASRLGKFDFDKLETLSRTNVLSVLEENNDYLPKDKYVLIPNPKLNKDTSNIFSGYLPDKNIRKGTSGNFNLSRTHKQQNRIWNSLGAFCTIPASEPSGRFWISIGEKVRRLTLRELYRLMGFSDDFKNNCSVSQQRKQIGNSIVVPMVRAIADQIKLQFTK